MQFVADTHALVWYLENDPQLGSDALQALDDPTSIIIVPAIVLAEIAFLFAKKRIPTDPQVVISKITSSINCRVHPLDEVVVGRMPRGLKIHDAIIVATVLVQRDVLKVPTILVTKDEKIGASGLVQVVW